MGRITPVDMEVLVDNDDVGLPEQISCLLPTEEIFCHLIIDKGLFVQHKFASLDC